LGCDELELPELAEFFRLEPPAARELLAAMVRCGLVERPKVRPQWLRRGAPAKEPLHALTPEGIRLCNALFLQRFDRAKADRLVTELLERTEAVAAEREDYLVEVTGIAIFGSYLDAEAADFGDIDVLIEARWLPEIPKDALPDRYHELFARDRRRWHRIGDEGSWPWEKLQRFLRGRTRYIRLHPLANAEVIETNVRVIYELPGGQLAPPRDCRPAEFVAAVDRLRTRQ
jgi:predicted nucleotidyltransferase